MLTDDQLKERLSYIGGSDAAAVLGLSRYKTRLQVWGEKTGNIVPEDISHKLQVKLGHKLEATVADLFCEATGKKVRRVNETIYHKEHPFLAANIDRRVVGDDAILECKTTSSFGAKNWEGDEIPQEYIIQVLHYLAVTGMSKAYIAVLIGNHEFKWKEIERDDAVIADLVKKEVEFWNTFVVPKQMPMDVDVGDKETLFKLFPHESEGTEVEFGDDIEALCVRRDQLKAEVETSSEALEVVENQIKAAMKESETGKTPVHKITWKYQERDTLDGKTLKAEHPDLAKKYTKTTQTRVLRITALKKEK